MNIVIFSKEHPVDIRLDDVKNHCRVDGDEDNSLLNLYIAAAVDLAEQKTSRALTTTKAQYLDDAWKRWFYLPFGELKSVESITCVSPEGETVLVRNPTVEFTKGNVRIPSSYANHTDFKIDFVCGYPPGSMPRGIVQAIYMTVMTLYNSREDISYGLNAIKIPTSSDRLLLHYKLPQFEVTE